MRKSSEKNSKGTKLSDELHKEIIELASRVAIEQYHKEGERTKKSVMDKRFHNTKLLMEKYRGFVIHSQSAVYDASQVKQDLSLEELLHLMGCGDGSPKKLSVESIQESAARTRIMVHHIDQMLEYYKFKCENSSKSEDRRRFRIIYGMYVSEEEKTAQELSEEENIDISTVYKDIKAALGQLSALIFGYFY